MTLTEKKYYSRKISALRKALQALEDELGVVETPAPRKQNLKQFFEEKYAAGTWGKPEHLKKKRA